MAQNPRMIRTGMHLTPAQVEALNAASAATGAPVAELVRRAVEAAYVRPEGYDKSGVVQHVVQQMKALASVGRATSCNGSPSL